MPPDPQNQTVPAPQTMQILVLLKATGDLTGVTPRDLAAYAAAWLRYEDDVAGVPVEVEARLDHASLDLVGLTGAEAAAESLSLALELLEAVSPGDVHPELRLPLAEIMRLLRLISVVVTAGVPVARP